MLIAYASRTGNKRMLAALREAGWRLVISAADRHRDEGFRFGIDNGAWTAYRSGKKWSPKPFEKLVESHGDRADWIVAPDIVGGGLESLRLTESWLPRLPGLRLVAVQDGIEPADIRGWLGEDTGIFLGGTTEWKLRTIFRWGELAAERGCWFHVGRVNSVKRLRLCVEAGATSFDGSSPAIYPDKLELLDRARRQLCSSKLQVVKNGRC